MDPYDAWKEDEIRRQQLAVVVRDDILAISRFLINKHRFNLHLGSTLPDPEATSSSPSRPSTVAARPGTKDASSSTGHRPSSVPNASFRPNKVTLVARDKALDGTDLECQACAKAIMKEVITYMDSADVRFEVAERLLLLAEQEEKDAAELAKYRAALEAGDLESVGFTEKEVKSIKEKKKARTIENFLRNLQVSKSQEEVRERWK